MLAPDILHAAAQVGRDEVEHVNVVKPPVDRIAAQSREADELRVHLVCHVHQGLEQMGRVRLGEGIVHNEHFALVAVGKDVRLVAAHVIQQTCEYDKRGQKALAAGIFCRLRPCDRVFPLCLDFVQFDLDISDPDNTVVKVSGRDPCPEVLLRIFVLLEDLDTLCRQFVQEITEFQVIHALLLCPIRELQF